VFLSDKESEAYKSMKVRYDELKVVFNTFSVNMTDIDRIKE